MHTQNIKTRTSQRPGPSIRAGSKGHKPLRSKRGPRQGPVAIRFARLYSLTFEPKKGGTVLQKLSGGKVFDDLFAAFANYYFLIHGQKPETFDVKKYKSPVSRLKELFKDLIGELDFNIEKNNKGDYHFVIYKKCKYDWGWYCIEIKYIVRHLAETNQELHDIFILFLKSFTRATHIDFWFDYTMEHAVEWLEENLEQMAYEDEDHAENFKEYYDCLHEYQTGNAAKYNELINKAPVIEPEALAKKIQKLNIIHPIINMMLDGCEIAKEPVGLHDFIYNPNEADEDEDYERLELPYTITFLWDAFDSVTEQHTQWMDENAGNSGIGDPYSKLTVDRNTTELFKMSDWPKRMQEYIGKAVDTIKEVLKDEQNNKAV